MRNALVLALGLSAVALGGDQTSPAAQTPPARPAASIVIAEVLFDPEPNTAPFIELLNTGSAAVDLKRMALDFGTGQVPLARLDTPLAPDSRLVVRLDGKGTLEAGIFHPPQGVTMDAAGGAVELRDERGEALDRISWGAEDGAIDGELAEDTGSAPLKGRTIGRPPGANRPFDLLEWTLYKPDESTPGRENPLPRVKTLVPLNGDIVTGPRVTLNWYPVTGAARYHVQLARDRSFTAPLLDVTVASRAATADSLSPGRYAWRVQPIDAKGAASRYSDIHDLEVEAAGGLFDSSQPAIAMKVSHASTVATAPAFQGTVLPVGLIKQHKDTRMLQLESRKETDPHGWDVDHKDYDASDLSDMFNCVLASIAMANHFLGGDLSQDRIGYEVKSRNGAQYAPMILASPNLAGLPYRGLESEITKLLKEMRPGPEFDLLIGAGLKPPQVIAAMTFAFGGLARQVGFKDADSLWNAVTAEIDRGRPVLTDFDSLTHMSLVKGYGTRTNGDRFFVVNDPILGQLKRAIAFGHWYFLPANPVVRKQELSVTQDSDFDGVVDFDETERFFTDPNNRDTDQDRVPDKADIASGVFDPKYGYAFNLSSPLGRDFNRDRVPTERDPDSDAGGCVDGLEDADFDGHRNGPETWNFDDEDDICRDINGKVTWRVSYEGIGGMDAYVYETFVVTVRLKPRDPGQMGPLVDNGSRYRYSHVALLDLGNMGCQAYGREEIHGSGAFDKPDDRMGGNVSPEELAIGATASSLKGIGSMDMCVVAGSGPTEGNGTLGGCTAKRVAGTPSYRFNCTTPPANPPGTRFIEWSQTGLVTLELGREVLPQLLGRNRQ